MDLDLWFVFILDLGFCFGWFEFEICLGLGSEFDIEIWDMEFVFEIGFWI